MREELFEKDKDGMANSYEEECRHLKIIPVKPQKRVQLKTHQNIVKSFPSSLIVSSLKKHCYFLSLNEGKNK